MKQPPVFKVLFNCADESNTTVMIVLLEFLYKFPLSFLNAIVTRPWHGDHLTEAKFLAVFYGKNIQHVWIESSLRQC